MITYLVGTALLAIFLYEYVFWRIKQFRLRKALGLQGPPTNFFLGTLGELFYFLKKSGLEASTQFAEENHAKYGDTFGWYNGPFLDIVTRDPEFAREVFISQFGNFVDRQTIPLNDAFPFWDGLLAINSEGHGGVGWKDIRSVVSPVFTSGKLKKMHHLLLERVDALLEVLEGKMENGTVSLEIYDELQSFTMDTIARVALGVDCDSLHDRKDTFYVNSRTFFAEFNLEASPIAVLFAYVFPSIAHHFRSFTSFAKAEKLLIDRLRQVNTDFTKSMDLVQLLLEQDLERQKGEKKAPLSDDIIITNCFHFLLAGYETTSTALSFAMWCLAESEEAQERLYNDIIDTFGESGELDYEKVMKLPYLDCVFREVLRRYPPVVLFTSRKCIRETTVQGQLVPKGVTVTVPVHAIQWSEKYWDKPFEFRPERFEDPEAKKKISWLPFGLGPRNCVGMRFAEMEFKSALAALVRKFKIGKQPDAVLKTRLQLILMRPLNGVNITLEKR
ncbi:unnamed protein product, partial [Mesorhabditis spiculigera]